MRTDDNINTGNAYLPRTPVVPFCIYRNKRDNVSSLLKNPILKKSTGNSLNYECDVEVEDNVFYGRFYAISPMFIPIPTAMKLFAFEISNVYPYRITDFYRVYDPFNRKDNLVYLITYNKPTTNTVPLYIYKNGDNIYPSFEKNILLKEHELSPIYVMDKLYDKFVCINGRVIPWSENITGIYQEIYNENKKFDVSDFGETSFMCNEIHIAKAGDNSHMDLSEVLHRNNKIRGQLNYLEIIVGVVIFLLFIFLYKK